MYKQLSNLNVSIWAWIALLLLSLIWGSSFILIKKSLLAFSALEVGALRLSIATIAFIPFFISHFKEIPWDKFKFFLLVGLAGSGIPSFLYAIAQTNVDSSIAGLLNSLTPIFTLIIGLVIFKTTFIKKQLFGILIAFLGAVALIWLSTNSIRMQASLGYSFLLVLATVCYGTSVNVVKYRLDGLKPMLISAVSFMVTGPIAIMYVLTTDFLSDIQNHPDGVISIISVTTLALFSTFISTIIFYKLVHWTNPIFSSSVSFIIPIVALGWGFIDGETVGVAHLISLACILMGVYMLRVERKRKNPS